MKPGDGGTDAGQRLGVGVRGIVRARVRISGPLCRRERAGRGRADADATAGARPDAGALPLAIARHLVRGVWPVLRYEAFREAERHRGLVGPRSGRQAVDRVRRAHRQQQGRAASRARGRAGRAGAAASATARRNGPAGGLWLRCRRGPRPAAHELRLRRRLGNDRPGARARVAAPLAVQFLERGVAAGAGLAIRHPAAGHEVGPPDSGAAMQVDRAALGQRTARARRGSRCMAASESGSPWSGIGRRRYAISRPRAAFSSSGS